MANYISFDLQVYNNEPSYVDGVTLTPVGGSIVPVRSSEAVNERHLTRKDATGRDHVTLLCVGQDTPAPDPSLTKVSEEI